MQTADDLRRVADIIDGFPKFIRRDIGSQGVEGSLKLLLEPYGLSDNAELVAALAAWSRKIRDTQLDYYLKKFDAT